jgi:GDP-L-fucose synthase
MSKILITGGTGLIGSAFKEGIKVGSSQYNLISRSQTDQMIKDYKPEVIIHSAAKVGGIGANISQPANFYYDNIMMNSNIIDSAYKHGIKKLVCFLSTCVFPDKIDYPLTEDKIHEGKPHSTNSSYAYSKRMADIQIKAYNKQYNTNYFSIIPCNVYGLNDNFNLQNGHVIPTLIHKCWIAKQNNTAFEIWGNGSALREFIFANDVADIVLKLVDIYNATDAIIISNPQEYSIKQLVDLIVQYMEFTGEVIWLSDKPNGQLRKPSSNKKLLSVIGEYNFTTLEIGLKNTIDWFKLNYKTARK